MNKQISILGYSLIISLFLPVTVAFANQTLPTVRVFYRPDGGVSILHFVTDACRQRETKTQCMDRISGDSAYKNLPYDDMPLSQLPKDRADRDKWRGEKGKGVRVDHSLITKNEKINQLNSELDKELDKNEPNSSRVLKLQHLVEKAKDIDHTVLTDNDLAIFENKQKSILATVVNVIGDLVGDVFSIIKNEFLALKSLLVEKIQIGTVEKPAGITTYDLETRQPYCQVVRSGKLELIAGECPAEFTPKAEPQIENAPDQNTIPAASGGRELPTVNTSVTEVVDQPTPQPEVVSIETSETDAVSSSADDQSAAAELPIQSTEPVTEQIEEAPATPSNEVQ